jgi:hypothetical protein
MAKKLEISHASQMIVRFWFYVSYLITTVTAEPMFLQFWEELDT